MTIARLPDTDLFYQEHGDGPPLVMLHGSGGCHLSWWQQVPAFQEQYRVVIFDQRGFGRSVPRGEFNPGDGAALTRDLENLINHLDIDEPVRFIGQSFGTFAALDYAAQYPERVAGLVLASAYGSICTAPLAEAVARREEVFSKPRPPQSPRLRLSKDEVTPFSIFDRTPNQFGPATLETRPDLAHLYESIAALSNGPPMHLLAPVFQSVRPIKEAVANCLEVPILFIGGDQDFFFPPQELALAASAFPHAKHIIIEGVGHSAHFEQAERFNAEVSAFLNSL